MWRNLLYSKNWKDGLLKYHICRKNFICITFIVEISNNYEKLFYKLRNKKYYIMAITGKQLPKGGGGIIIRVHPSYFNYDKIVKLVLYNTNTSLNNPLFEYSSILNPDTEPAIEDVFMIKIPASDAYIGTMSLYVQNSLGTNKTLDIEYLGSDYEYCTWQIYNFINNGH